MGGIKYWALVLGFQDSENEIIWNWKSRFASNSDKFSKLLFRLLIKMEKILLCFLLGVFKRRNGETAKWQYISVFQKGKIYVANVLNLQRLSFKIRSKPARKHSTYLHRKLEIIRSFHTANSSQLSIVHSKCREDRAGEGAFYFTAISCYFLRPCCFLM